MAAERDGNLFSVHRCTALKMKINEWFKWLTAILRVTQFLKQFQMDEIAWHRL